jgi:iron complex transport system substrate-binding protein
LLLTAYFSLLSVCSAEPQKRIVSLAPNVTEILFALGLDEKIVGVSSFCDYPEEAKKKTKVGGMSNPSLESVVSLKPDIVILSTDGNPKEFEERLRSMKIRTYVFRTKGITDLPQGIRDMGAALDAKEKAEKLARDIETRLGKIRDLKSEAGAGKKRNDTARKIKAMFIIWPEPLIVAGPGSVADDALSVLGIENIAADTKSSYPKYSIEEILSLAPDIIFIGKGKGMDKVSEGLLRRLKSVPAVKNEKVFYVSDYLYRLGPRTVMGIEELARLLQK